MERREKYPGFKREKAYQTPYRRNKEPVNITSRNGRKERDFNLDLSAQAYYWIKLWTD